MKLRLLEYDHIVFDWNGTVVDDLGLAVQSLNRVREDVNLGAVDADTYRRHFRFPIAEFYASIGFDFRKRSFVELVTAYLYHFDNQVADCEICAGFHDLADALRQHNVPISVLSASHQKTLERIAQRKQLAPLVTHLYGLDDEAAMGKLDRARDLDRLIGQSGASSVLMIGDTDHDYDVALDRGWDFVAVASGHQHRDRLEELGTPVVDQLGELMDFAPLQSRSVVV
ncbi:phosphoglycolate phosphatase [Roseibium hamelinense]|uniref:phosphoglycolate phosphatase n=1 Tax=Roseibium hamelinense TaxID=150831 RepID=A0A562T2Z8_9HYPH|nr:HAD hydrolase-like protein [Roseibium hamelinense]MTI44619.1 HAD family hydrolase [Roseibium hamelinense]TWI87246.1 phosphoglycolate phosphatase [Roseibium hamelinense]